MSEPHTLNQLSPSGVIEADLINQTLLLGDGRVVPILKYRDFDDQEVSDPSRAFSAIAGPITIEGNPGKMIMAVITHNEREKFREHIRTKQPPINQQPTNHQSTSVQA